MTERIPQEILDYYRDSPRGGLTGQDASAMLDYLIAERDTFDAYVDTMHAPAIVEPGQVVILTPTERLTPQDAQAVMRTLTLAGERTGVEFVVIAGGLKVARIGEPA
jgi:hypothetical protein